jgi:hypothetical protein
MNKFNDMVNGAIIPTPGAVMESTKLLYEILGDGLVIDVGGAATDVHSVTEGSTEILDMLVSPEPKAKRTVDQCSLLLTRKAVEVAVTRHAGYLKRNYGAGNQIIAYGKDLSKVKFIIGTGGALTRLQGGEKLLRDIRYSKEDLTM